MSFPEASPETSKPGQPFPERFADLLADAVADSLDFRLIEKAAREAAEQFMAGDRTKASRRLFLVGSGDSLFAALSALPALRRWTGLIVEARTSIEFSRYEIPVVQDGDVLVAVSNSGGSSRTREGVLLAKERGLPTVGVTGSSDGPLAQSADIVLHRPVQAYSGAPEIVRRALLHTSEFLAALAALYTFGLNLGVARGQIAASMRDETISELRGAVASLGTIAAASEPAVVEFLNGVPDLDTVFVLGAGPNRGCAEYCAAKFHEQVPINGVPQDLEEWAHLQYFLTYFSWRSRGPIVVLAPEGNALDRAREIVTGIRSAGGRSLLVTNSTERFEDAELTFRIEKPADELLTPATFHIPCQLMTLHLARLRGVNPTPLRRRDDFWLIRKGNVLSSRADLK